MRKPTLPFPLHAVASVIVAMGSGAAQSATVNWIGATSTWNTASNWSSNPLLPGSADDVVINVAGVQTITHGTGTDTVKSLSITGDDILSVTGGVLDAGILSNTGTINVGSGTFGVTSGTSGTMNLTGGITALTGTLSLTGAVTMSGGTIQGGTVQENAANALKFTNSTSTLDGVTVRGVLNVGDATNTSARVRVSNGLTVLTEAGGSPGVINVGTVAGASNAVIGFTGTQTFNNATINLGSATQGGYLSLDSGGTLTLGSGAVVQGQGSLGQAQFQGGTNNLVSNGLISANINGGVLGINNSGTFTNNGTAQASNGGTLTIAPSGTWSNAGLIKVADASSTINLGGTVSALGTFDNTAGGKLNLTGTLTNTGSTLTFSPATGSIRLVGGTITGGTVQESGSNGLVFTSGTSTLDGVTVRGVLNVGDATNTSARVRVSNGLTVLTEAGGSPGVINVGTVAGASNAVIGFTGTQTFNNATINLGSATQGGYLSLDSGGTLTLGSGAVVQGQGSLGQAQFQGGTNNLVSNGLISANINGGVLGINNSGTFTNNGTAQASNGGTLTIAPSGTWSNAGLIKVADASSTINLGGTVSALGTFDNTAGGKLNLTGTLTNTGSTLTFSPATGSIRLVGGTITGGTVQESGSNGLVFTSGTSTLDGVTVRGVLNVGDATNTSARVRVSNGLTVLTEAGGSPGVINVGTVAGASNAVIGFTGTQTFNNATINLGNATQAGYLSLDAGGTLTLGSGAVVQGQGSLGQAQFQGGTNNLVSNGLISANINGGVLGINNSGTFTNNGTAQASNGGTLTIAPSGTWSNAGLIKVADASSTINLGGTVSALGTFDNTAGGKLNLTGTLTNTGSTLTFSPATGSIRLVGGTITGGTVQESGSNGLVFTSGTSTLDGVTVRGVLNVGDATNTSARVRVSNGLTVLTEAGGSPGVINVGTVAGASNAVIGFTGTQTFNNATINLGSATQGGTVSLDAGGTLTLGSGAVVQGQGSLGQAQFQGGTNNLVSNGLISANINGGVLGINNSGTFTNNGTAQASNGGTLTIAPSGTWSNAGLIKVADASSTINLGGTVSALGTFDNTAGGKLNLTGTLTNTGSTLTFSPATGSIRLVGGTITGGTVQESGSNGLVFTSGTSTLDGVTVRGVLNVGDATNTSARVRVSNGLTVLTEAGGSPGVINVGTVAGASNAVIGFTGTQTFNNATINLGSATQGGTVSLDAGGTLTLGSGAVVQGQGSLGQAQFQGGTNNLVNNGLISATVNGAGLQINTSGTFTNSGTVQALSGATLTIQSVSVTNLSGGTLTGGVWKADASAGTAGLIQFNSPNKAITTNAADIYLIGANSAITGYNAVGAAQSLDTTLVTNNGQLRLQGGRSFNATGGGGNFTNNGLIELTGGTFTATTLASNGNIANVGTGSIATAAGNRITGNGAISTTTGVLTLTQGVNMGVGSSLTSSSGGTINLSNATLASQVAILNNNAALNLGSQNLVVTKDYTNANFGTGNAFNARANVTGAGQIIGNNAAQTITGNATAGAANQFTVDFGAIRGSGSGTVNFQIANSGTGADIRGGLLTSNIDSRLSGAGVTAGNFGPIAAGGNSGNLAITVTGGAVGGALTGTLQVVSNFSNVATQTITLNGTTSVLAVGNATPNPNPLNLGAFRVGSAGATSALAIQNSTNVTGAEQLGINGVTASSGFGAVNGLGAGLIAPGATAPGGVTVAASGAGTAGINTGTVAIQYATDGTNVNAAFTRQAANLQTINVTATGYNAAVGSTTPTPITIANQRVGGSGSQVLTVANTAAAGSFSEALNANLATGGTATGSGSVVNIAAGSNNTALSVGVNTASAGAKGGTATLTYQTDGTGTNGHSGLAAIAAGSQAISVSGNVYNMAIGSTTPTPITIANQRIGGTGSQALTVANTAMAGSFSEALNASFTGNTGATTTAGSSINNLAAGASNAGALSVGVNTTTSGAKSGAVTIGYQSDGTGPNGNSGLAAIAAGSQTVNVSGNVYQAAAGSILTSPLNFGTVQVGTVVTQNLAVRNIATGAAGFVEDLNASFGSVSGSSNAGFISGSGSVSGLVAGSTSNALTVNVNTSSAGVVNGAIAVNYTTAGAVGGVSNGLGTAAVGSEGYGVSGTIQGTANVVDQAKPVVNNPTIALGNVRIGAAAPLGLVSVTNQATGNQQAALNASISGNAPINASGSFNLLAPGSTNAASLAVGFNTATAGNKSGTATINFVSDASNIGNCGSNCQLTLASQNVNVSGAVYQIAQANVPTTVTFGNVHVGSAVSQAVTIGNTNIAPAGYQEGLDVAIASKSAGTSASGSVANLAAGSTSNAVNVGFTSVIAGAQSGNVVLNLASNGATTSGLSTFGLGTGSVAVSATGYNLAAGAATPTPVTIANQRVGGTGSQALTVQNTAASGSFTEGLNASFGTNSGAATNNGGAVNLLAGQATSNSGLAVGVNTSLAGSKTGSVTINYVSDGTGTSGLGTTAIGNQSIVVSGNVYNMAIGSTTPTPITIANQRIGGTGSQALTVANTAMAGSFSEALNASFTGNTGATTTAGSGINNLAAGASNASALSVGVNTTTSGAKSGTVTIGYQSDGTGPNGNSGLAAIAAGGQTVNVSGNVYQAAAGSILTSPLNFGTVQVGAVVTQNLAVRNIATGAAGFVEDLNASFGSVSGSSNAGFISGSGSVSGLVAGSTSNALTVNVNTSSAGVVNGAIAVNYTTAGAVGGVSNGLGTAAVGSEGYGVSGTIQGTANVVDQAKPVVNNPTIALGNVRINATAPSGLVSVTNQATGNQQAALNASISGNASVTASGSFNLLAPGSTNAASLAVGFNTTTAGNKSGTATINFVSDASNIGNCGSNCQLTLASQNVNVSGAVYRLADGTVNTSTPITLAARVGQSGPAAAISITNASPDVFTEGLSVSRGATSAGFTSAGSITNLAAGASSTAVNVHLNTATAGTFTGTQALNYVSTGAGTTGATDMAVGGASVDLVGKVYTQAAATLNTSNVSFGIVHVGDTVTQNVSVTNGAASTALNDVLLASASGTSGAPFSATGTLGSSGLAAQSTSIDALKVGLSTTTAGVFAGNATFNASSHDGDLSDVALANLVVGLTGQVNNYASDAFKFGNGQGTFVRLGNTFILDYGSIVQNSGTRATTLFATNDATGPADALAGIFQFVDPKDFGESGFSSFAGLGTGGLTDALNFSFSSTDLGSFADAIVLHGVGSNASGYSGILDDVTLLVRGTVISAGQSVPEPDSLLLLALGLPLLFVRRKARPPVLH